MTRRGILTLLLLLIPARPGFAWRRLDPEARSADGLPLIFELIEREDMRGVVRLLDAGADIEAKGFAGQTPILKAAIIDYWQMVELLLERGAKAAIWDSSGFTLPHLLATTRVIDTGPYGEAKLRVRRYLDRQGLMQHIHHPLEVRQWIAEGNWPPVGFRD